MLVDERSAWLIGRVRAGLAGSRRDALPCGGSAVEDALDRPAGANAFESLRGPAAGNRRDHPADRPGHAPDRAAGGVIVHYWSAVRAAGP